MVSLFIFNFTDLDLDIRHGKNVLVTGKTGRAPSYKTWFIIFLSFLSPDQCMKDSIRL